MSYCCLKLLLDDLNKHSKAKIIVDIKGFLTSKNIQFLRALEIPYHYHKREKRVPKKIRQFEGSQKKSGYLIQKLGIFFDFLFLAVLFLLKNKKKVYLT